MILTQTAPHSMHGPESLGKMSQITSLTIEPSEDYTAHLHILLQSEYISPLYN